MQKEYTACLPSKVENPTAREGDVFPSPDCERWLLLLRGRQGLQKQQSQTDCQNVRTSVLWSMYFEAHRIQLWLNMPRAKCEFVLNVNAISFSVADPGFPRREGGVTVRGGGANLLFFKMLLKTACK